MIKSLRIIFRHFSLLWRTLIIFYFIFMLMFLLFFLPQSWRTSYCLMFSMSFFMFLVCFRSTLNKRSRINLCFFSSTLKLLYLFRLFFLDNLSFFWRTVFLLILHTQILKTFFFMLLQLFSYDKFLTNFTCDCSWFTLFNMKIKHSIWHIKITILTINQQWSTWLHMIFKLSFQYSNMTITTLTFTMILLIMLFLIIFITHL